MRYTFDARLHAGPAGRRAGNAVLNWLASYRFDSTAKLSRVRGPVLMVHGLRDQLIPIGAARALFGSIPGPKELLETTDRSVDAISRALAPGTR